jgi:hypothetical protein
MGRPGPSLSPGLRAGLLSSPVCLSLPLLCGRAATFYVKILPPPTKWGEGRGRKNVAALRPERGGGPGWGRRPGEHEPMGAPRETYEALESNDEAGATKAAPPPRAVRLGVLLSSPAGPDPRGEARNAGYGGGPAGVRRCSEPAARCGERAVPPRRPAGHVVRSGEGDCVVYRWSDARLSPRRQGDST